MTVDTHPSARRELAVAANRLETARRGYGGRLREAVRKTLRDIANTPFAFPPDDDAPAGYDVRYVYFDKYQYRILFAVLDPVILVVAVTHVAHEPGYWVERLPAPPSTPASPPAPLT